MGAQVPSSRPRTVLVATNTVPLAARAVPPAERDVVSAREALQRLPRPEVGPPVTGRRGLYHAKRRWSGWKTKRGGKKYTMEYAHACHDLKTPFSCITTAFDNQTAGRFLIKTKSGFRLLGEQEARRLMTFDIHYPFAGTKKQRMAQLGNAIPPEFARRLFRHITRNVVKFHRTP